MQIGFNIVDNVMQAPTQMEPADPLPQAITMTPPYCVLEFRSNCIWCNEDLYNEYIKSVLGEETYAKRLVGDMT